MSEGQARLCCPQELCHRDSNSRRQNACQKSCKVSRSLRPEALMSFKYSLAARQNAVRKPKLVTGECKHASARQPAFSSTSSHDHQQTSAVRSHKGKCRSARNNHADFGERLTTLWWSYRSACPPWSTSLCRGSRHTAGRGAKRRVPGGASLSHGSVPTCIRS